MHAVLLLVVSPEHCRAIAPENPMLVAEFFMTILQVRKAAQFDDKDHETMTLAVAGFATALTLKGVDALEAQVVVGEHGNAVIHPNGKGHGHGL